MFLLNSGVGKDWASPFSPPPPPPPLGSNLSIYLSVLGLNYSYTESEHSWLTYLKEKFKLQALSQMILLNRGVGKDWAGPFFPPSPPPKCYFLSIYLYVYTTISLYLSSNDYWNMSRRNPSFLIANFTKCLANWFFIIVGWGKTRPAHSFPPSLFFNLSIYLSVFWFKLLLNRIWTLIMDFPKEKFKLKHLANCMFLPKSGVGKDWASPSFPPSIASQPFNLSVSLLV